MSKEYIEREKAIEWFMAFVHMGESDIPAETVISDLKYAIPAADVVPVVHGRWIGIDSSFWKPTHSSDIPVFRKTYRCSECRRRTAIAENYCPNCGAKMEKAETNELDKR